MSEKTGIQSAIRQQKQQGGGNLLKAEVENGQVDQERVRVTFTGTLTNDKTTEFYKEEYGAGTYTLRYELANGKWYYLCAEDDEVFLVKSVSKAPKDKKFMFQTEYPVSDGGRYLRIKSLGTEKFLGIDGKGNASLRDSSSDSWTWLTFLEPLKTAERESFF